MQCLHSAEHWYDRINPTEIGDGIRILLIYHRAISQKIKIKGQPTSF
jgi:hypothetical protein